VAWEKPSSLLCIFADEIIEELDHRFTTEYVDAERVGRAESLIWLWVLGAYEIVRTMDQAKKCFSERLNQELRGLKKVLANVRMPAAKMEKPGKKLPVTSNRSPSGWDPANRDVLVNDPEDNTNVSARWLLVEFDRVLCSIERSDVLAHHETSY